MIHWTSERGSVSVEVAVIAPAFVFLMLLVVAVYLVAVAKLWRDNLDANQVALTHVNSMLVQGVRTTLKGHELILRGLGGQLVSMGALDDPARGRELVERMRDIDPGMVGFGLARPDGQLVLVSGIPDGEPLPNLAARDPDDHSFDAAARDGALRIGRPYFFARLGRWVVPIRVPIQDATGVAVAPSASWWSATSCPKPATRSTSGSSAASSSP